MSQPVLQPILPNRKRPEFRICPVCGVEFYVRNHDQRWCSNDCVYHTRRCANAVVREIKRREPEKARP